MRKNAKLSDEQVREICRKLNQGASLRELSQQFNVSVAAISQIAVKKTYTKIGEQYLKERIKHSAGVRHPLSKFSEEDVHRIRELYNKYETRYSKLIRSVVAKEYAVSVATVCDLVNGNTYKSVK